MNLIEAGLSFNYKFISKRVLHAQKKNAYYQKSSIVVDTSARKLLEL